MSHEETISIGVGGKEVLIRTVVGGKKVSNDEAIKAFFAGDNPAIRTFDSIPEAESYARGRSEEAGHQGSISEVPRKHTALGAIAEALRGVQAGISTSKEHGNAAGKGAAALLEMILGKAPEVVENASYGFPAVRGKGWATQVNPDLLDVGGIVPGPGGVAKGAKVSSTAAKSIADAILGSKGLEGLSLAALFPGGRKDLIATHASKMLDLFENTTRRGPLSPDARLRQELYSPSLAISPPGTVSKHFVRAPHDNVIFVAKEGAFDPRLDTTTLLNRDAWTHRYPQYGGSNNTAARQSKLVSSWARPTELDQLITNRLADRFGRHKNEMRFGANPDGPPVPVKFGEDLPDDYSHQASIATSPHFASFKHFENDPKGAAVLTSEKGAVEDWATDFGELIESDPGWANLMHAYKVAGVKGDVKETLRIRDIMEDWRKIRPELDSPGHAIKSAQRAPSEYAELKAHGPVQVSQDRWAGAINLPEMDRFNDPTDLNRLFAREMLERGIPVITPQKGHGASEEELFQLALMLQEQAKKFGRTPLP